MSTNGLNGAFAFRSCALLWECDVDIPGTKSYGLGKLCAIYGIEEPKDHHRALCDARAAARLLNLINKKRDDVVSTEAVQAA